MENKGYNPKFMLTEEQATELKKLWDSCPNQTGNSKDTLMKLKMTRRRPVLTRKQLYMFSATMINDGVTIIPDWIHEILDEPENVHVN